MNTLSMISTQNYVLYVCIAKGTTTLADVSHEPGLEVIAKLCIEKTPPNHSMFSHTIRKKTYTFLIGDPFVYFGVFNENPDQSQGLCFLNSIKQALEEMINTGSVKDSVNLDSYCFQAQFDAIFRDTMAIVESPVNESKYSRNPSLDSAPLLKNSEESNGEDRGRGLENKVNVKDDVNHVNRDFPANMLKSCSYVDRRNVNKVWRKHVWIVLSLDFFVCVVLFGIWLCICQGFECVNG